MVRKLVSAFVIGAGLLAAAGSASAAAKEINLYGASAQYLFWNDAADNFLSTTFGCVTTQKSQDSGKKNGITEASGCTDGNTYTFRYSSKASYDGIYAVKGTPVVTTFPEKCNDGDPVCPPSGGTVPAGQASYYRKMSLSFASPGASCCARVNIGASDVAGASFIQTTRGELKGPALGGSVTRIFNGIDTTGLDFKNPLIVPFGFFANNTVTVTQCVEPKPDQPTEAHKAISKTGNFCYDPDGDGKSSNCIGYYKCQDQGSGLKCLGGVNINQACTKIQDCPDVTLANTACERLPLANMTRSMATLIFGGKVKNWQDFGAYFDGDGNTATTSDLITACFRHAGSGTHATMDLGVMRGNGWGITILQNQNTNPAASIRWFNDGSGDLMKCLQDLNGSVGYADCDQLVGQDPVTSTKVHALKYQGAECSRPNIRNGVYDFWSTQWLYYDATSPVYDATLFNALFAFAADPAKIPTTKADYWAAEKEMKVKKVTDFTYLTNQNPALPQLP